MNIIVVLTIIIISRSYLTIVLAIEKMTKGPVTCENVVKDIVHCCQTETRSDDIEIM